MAIPWKNIFCRWNSDRVTVSVLRGNSNPKKIVFLGCPLPRMVRDASKFTSIYFVPTTMFTLTSWVSCFKLFSSSNFAFFLSFMISYKTGSISITSIPGVFFAATNLLPSPNCHPGHNLSLSGPYHHKSLVLLVLIDESFLCQVLSTIIKSSFHCNMFRDLQYKTEHCRVVCSAMWSKTRQTRMEVRNIFL